MRAYCGNWTREERSHGENSPCSRIPRSMTRGDYGDSFVSVRRIGAGHLVGQWQSGAARRDRHRARSVGRTDTPIVPGKSTENVVTGIANDVLRDFRKRAGGDVGAGDRYVAIGTGSVAGQSGSCDRHLAGPVRIEGTADVDQPVRAVPRRLDGSRDDAFDERGRRNAGVRVVVRYGLDQP